MTTDEKISEIHDAAISIQANMEAGKIVCSTRHGVIDDRISGLHRTIKGNGQPGIEQNLTSLTTHFNKLETKVVIWASIAVLLGQIFGLKLLKAAGWGDGGLNGHVLR